MPDNDTIESSASDFGTPFRALLDHCENKGLKFRANQKKKRIKLTLCRRHALYNCNLQITHKDSVSAPWPKPRGFDPDNRDDGGRQTS